MNYKYLSLIFTFNVFSVSSYAQNCPTPRSAIDMGVQVNTAYNKNTQDYTYTYKISNDAKAKLAISMIRIESSEQPKQMVLPKDWKVELNPASSNGEVANLVFSNIENDIAPGAAAYVFKFNSKLRPGLTKIYAEGSGPGLIQKAAPTNNDPEAAPSCPGYDSEAKNILEEMLVTSALGPVVDTQKDVKLKVKVRKDNPSKNWDDEGETPEISALDKGKLEVIAYDLKDIDVREIDLKSIKMGPGKASPISVQIINKAPEHWRHSPISTSKIIFMEFGIADLKIRCNLDRSLFLTASAGKKNLLGALAINPGICIKKNLETNARQK